MIRERIVLDGEWRFMPDPYDCGDRHEYWQSGLDDSGWQPARLPASFDQISPELDGYEGAGWFRCAVDVPAAWQGQRVALQFAGVNDHSRVWLNGVPVAANDCGFLPFAAEVAAQLRYGAPNQIAVRTDNVRVPEDLFRDSVGWRPRGGILREVTLVATATTYLQDLHVTAEPTPAGGQLTLAVCVRNAAARPFAGELQATVLDSAGAMVAELPRGPVSVAAGREETVTLRARVPGAAAWSPDRPVLYTARVALQRGTEAVDAEAVRFGFRSIRTAGVRLLLNGQPIRLRGVNRHEDTPLAGLCPDPAGVRRDLESIQAAGANFVRLAHYPHHPLELDLCDELGLLVLDEIPLYWWQGEAEPGGACARKLAAAGAQLERMIRRDRNHPSVIFWSVSNETNEALPEVRAGTGALLRRARALDPTRLAVHVSDRAWVEADLFSEDDVICVNAYPSMKPVLVDGGSTQDLSNSTHAWRTFLAQLHERYPTKPILVSEFGFVALAGVVAGPLGEETQAQVLAAEHAGMAAEYVCGATVWCWADHAWPHGQDHLRRMATSPYGVVTRGRRPKRALATLRRLFAAPA